MESVANTVHREPWNKGKIVGQKAPFKLKDIWALRVRLQMQSRMRELALFNQGIDSKLRGCDLVNLKVRDICHSDQVAIHSRMPMSNDSTGPFAMNGYPSITGPALKRFRRAFLVLKL